MQLDPRALEHEAMRLLPGLIDELFDHQGEPFHVRAGHVNPDRGFDLCGRGYGRDWLFEVKASSSPGLVSKDAMRHVHPADALHVLVVPFMTRAGEKAARQLDLNWIDLSGNAHIRADRLYIYVAGKPSRFVKRGRPSSPFAPKSARITRVMLLEPGHWWRQKDLAATTDLDSGHVSRVVKRLVGDGLLEQGEDRRIRPRHPDALLDAWEDEYRFDRHQILRGHMSGTGIELARELEERLSGLSLRHAFTGLPSAWAYRGFARFRLSSVFVEGDPYVAADRVGLRINDRGANVQLIVPDDTGVFVGARVIDGVTCVSAVQTYLDLKHLPERSAEAAADLRSGGLWNGA